MNPVDAIPVDPIPVDPIPVDAVPVSPAPVPVPQRQCGRCRVLFDGDPELFFQTDWALCPGCREVLMHGGVAPA